MRKKTLLVSFVLLAAMVSLLFTGCGSDTGNTGTGQGNAATSGESTGSKVTEKNISFLDVMPSEERMALLKGILSKFQDANPSVKVEYTSVPWDEAYKKVVIMGSSGTLPDVFTGDVGIMLAMAQPGYAEKLTDKWNNWPYKDDLTAAATAASNMYTYNEDIYIIPDGFLLQGIFVRTDWLEELGIKIESLQDWTWEEYHNVIKQMTDKEKGRYGIAFRGGANGFLRFYEYLGSNLEVTNAFPDGTNKSILEHPEALKLFEEFYGLYKNGYTPTESVNWGFKEMVNAFVSDQCGTLNQTPEVTITCQKNMKDGTWTVLPQPRKEGAAKNHMTWGYSGGYLMSSSTPNKEAAWSVIEFISSPEINLEYSKGFGCLPIYKSALNDGYFQSGALKGYADQLLDPDIVYFSQPTELTQWGYFLSEYATQEVQKYMTGQQTAEETLNKLAQWMRENYDKDIAGKK